MWAYWCNVAAAILAIDFMTAMLLGTAIDRLNPIHEDPLEF